MNKPWRITEPETYKRMVARSTGDSIVVTSTEGLAEWANDAFLRLTGFSPEDIIGRNPAEALRGPETDTTTFEDIQAAVAKRRPITRKILNYHKDGSAYWTEMSVSPSSMIAVGTPISSLSSATSRTEKTSRNKASRRSSPRIGARRNATC